MIRLPTFTFIAGHPGSGKSTLADLLSQQDAGLIPMSFAAPLYDTLFYTFFGGPTSLDEIAAIKQSILPLTSLSGRQFLIDYGNFLKSKTNERILGDLAKARWETVREGYPRAVFDDARLVADIAPFIDGYGMGECLLLIVERPGIGPLKGDVGADLPLLRLPGIRKFILPNKGLPEEMLSLLSSFLSPVTLADL